MQKSSISIAFHWRDMADQIQLLSRNEKCLWTFPGLSKVLYCILCHLNNNDNNKQACLSGTCQCKLKWLLHASFPVRKVRITHWESFPTIALIWEKECGTLQNWDSGSWLNTVINVATTWICSLSSGYVISMCSQGVMFLIAGYLNAVQG